MTTELELALPLSSNLPGAADLRNYLAKQFIGVFDTAALTGEDFSIQQYRAIAVRGNDGDLVLYAYDSADTTTADDGGLTTIVVSGRRYKRTSEVVIRDAAKSATTTAPPASPAYGDTYIIPVAPSGDWASHAEKVATWTTRGWVYRVPFAGMLVYVEDDDTFYHYNAASNWVKGIPAAFFADGSIRPQKLINPFYKIKVEDERNAPPGGTPTDNTAYQVGTSPTGAFAGQASNIAIWNNDDSDWDFLTPAEGDEIYRRDVDLNYSYRSGAWEPSETQSGVKRAWFQRQSGESFGTITTTPVLGATISITSDTTKKLRITVRRLRINPTASITPASQFQFAIFKDTDSAPLAIWNGGGEAEIHSGNYAGTESTTDELLEGRQRTFLHDVVDNAAHTYAIGILRTSGTGVGNFDLTYEFEIEEIGYEA